MTVYVFVDVDRASGAYHSGGSVVVVAESDDNARRLIEATPHVIVNAADWEACHRYPLAGLHEETIFVFQDAGCC